MHFFHILMGVLADALKNLALEPRNLPGSGWTLNENIINSKQVDKIINIKYMFFN